MAITAWSAKVSSNSISAGEKAPASARWMAMAPMGWPSRMIGAASIERHPRVRPRARIPSSTVRSASMSGIWTMVRSAMQKPTGLGVSIGQGDCSRNCCSDPGKPPRVAARRTSWPSICRTLAAKARNSRIAWSTIASNTGCSSVCAWLITRRISAVAVCRSSASMRSRLRVSRSLKRRTFSIAMTA